MNANQPALVFMPFLGGSWLEWTKVFRELPPRYRCVGLDLPGFGGAAYVSGYSVEEMVAYVSSRVQGLERFVLVGHSMAGKVATVAAATAGVDGLKGLVLVAASPPSPEPMPDAKRAEMKASLGVVGPDDRGHAERYIRHNLAGELAPEVFEQAVDDVLRMNRHAWNAWLDSGSKEDWAERVGTLAVPALVIAGEKDKALGAKAQRTLVVPHFTDVQMEVAEDASHLIPMEQPLALAQLIEAFADRVFSGEGRNA